MPWFILYYKEYRLCQRIFRKKIQSAVKALQSGNGIIITDDDTRENEGDVIFACSTLREVQEAQMIRDCSGIICLVINEERANLLNLPLMTSVNKSKNHTNFTISIEAAENVTTGVSAKDRLTTILSASKKDASKDDIVSPGHVFPLIAKNGGVFERQGHTEATLDIIKIAGTGEFGVLCELTNQDGTMMKGDDIINYSKKYNMPVISVEDIINYRKVYNI